MGQALQLSAEEFLDDGVQKSPSSGRSQCRVDVVKGLLYGRCMIFLLTLTSPATSSLIVMPRYPVPGHRGMIDSVEEIPFPVQVGADLAVHVPWLDVVKINPGHKKHLKAIPECRHHLPILCRNDGPRHRTMELILVSGKFTHNDGLNPTHLSYDHG